MRVLRAVQIWSRDVGGSLLTQDGFCEQIYSATSRKAKLFEMHRIPRALMTADYFTSLSLQAKVLYGMLLDRMSKSFQNHWLNEEGKAYIIYPVNEIQEDLNLSRRKIMDNLSELEKVGLVERKKQGNGKPNCIYVKNFIVESR